MISGETLKGPSRMLDLGGSKEHGGGRGWRESTAKQKGAERIEGGETAVKRGRNGEPTRPGRRRRRDGDGSREGRREEGREEGDGGGGRGVQSD